MSRCRTGPTDPSARRKRRLKERLMAGQVGSDHKGKSQTVMKVYLSSLRESSLCWESSTNECKSVHLLIEKNIGILIYLIL